MAERAPQFAETEPLKVCRRDFSQRRREPRFPSDPVPATIQTTSGTHLGRVLDISRSGMRLELPVALPPLAEITVRFGTTLAAGEVRYCHQEEPAIFRIGLRTTEATRIA
jgi:hypothetical protein